MFLKHLPKSGISSQIYSLLNNEDFRPTANLVISKCDAYDYEKMDAVAINSFRGEYMYAYSWAEFTSGRYDSIKEEHNKVIVK